MGVTPPRFGMLVGLAAALGAFGAAAMTSAPIARADDITDAVDGILASGQTYFTTAAADFSAGELAAGTAAYFDGINDDLLGAPDNYIIGTIAELTNEHFQPLLDFPIPQPDSFANGLAVAQDFFAAGQGDFGDAVTALSGGDYATAAFDELVGFNVTSIVPLEEIILGSLVEIGK